MFVHFVYKYKKKHVQIASFMKTVPTVYTPLIKTLSIPQYTGSWGIRFQATRGTRKDFDLYCIFFFKTLTN